MQCQQSEPRGCPKSSDRVRESRTKPCTDARSRCSAQRRIAAGRGALHPGQFIRRRYCRDPRRRLPVLGPKVFGSGQGSGRATAFSIAAWPSVHSPCSRRAHCGNDRLAVCLCTWGGPRRRSLRLYSNQLTGPVPTELGNLSNLENLSLNNNALTGPIPTELGSLTALRNLALGGNELTGPDPDRARQPVPHGLQGSRNRKPDQLGVPPSTTTP